MTKSPALPHRRGSGFARASALVQGRVKQAGATRGFAVSRLLTHWAEIVGQDIAKAAHPLNVSYARQGIGATLTVLTTGAVAPLIQMRSAEICEKVNACYGYNAISRLRVTQTAPTGFAEGQVAFTTKDDDQPKTPEPKTIAKGETLAATVKDPTLRQALATLGANVLSKAR